MAISVEFSDQKVSISFQTDGAGFLTRLFSSQAIETKDWSKENQSLCLAFAELRAYQELNEESVTIDDESILLKHDAVAALSENAALALGLPETSPYILQADIQGVVGHHNFKLKATWSDGADQIACERNGAILKTIDGTYRIPDPLFSAIETAEGFIPEDTDFSGHWEALAHFRKLLGFVDEGEKLLEPTRGQRIKLTQALDNMEVYTAAAFSLHIDENENFSPMLFGSEINEKKSNGETINENHGCLSDVDQSVFDADPRRGFSSFDEAKGTYSLGANRYLIIDQNLLPALKVVRQKQKSSKTEQKEFLKNPIKEISTAIETHLEETGQLEGFDDIQIEEMVEQVSADLFVETPEYADRAIGIGVWERPNLSFVDKQSSPWMPETFGVQLGDQWVPLKVEETSLLSDKIEEAIRAGQKEIFFNGITVECTAEHLETVQNLTSQQEPESGRGSGPAPDGDPRQKDGPVHAAILQENFLEMEWEPDIPKRKCVIPKECPSSVQTTLMGHQEDSLQWMINAWESGLPGILNADDQGLGKTLQTLSFLSWLKDNMENGEDIKKAPILIVAPTSLLKNWEAEVSKHLDAEGLGILIRAYGSNLKKIKQEGVLGTDIQDGTEKLNFDDLNVAVSKGNGHQFWVLTTYRTLANYQHSFRTINFSTVIFDEIQNIKNPASFNSHAARSVVADFRIGLTGTPIENHVADLWAIIDSLAPGRQGALKDFVGYFKEVTEEKMKRLHKSIFEGMNGFPAVGLRRMKEEVIGDLPRKDYMIYREDMPAEQMQAYDAIRPQLKDAAKGSAIKLLHHIRSVSLHPDRVDTCGADHYGFADKSARLKAALKVLAEIRERKERALVFIEDHRMQWFFKELLSLSFGLSDVRVINGQTPIPRRMRYVDEFQHHLKQEEEFDVMILGPKAAGVGLTLTAATHVIHLSRWWNPAVEEQCNDRIYRIGQKMDVKIHIPLAIHPGYKDRSFDCILNSLIKRKKALSRSVLWPPTNDDFDIRNLMEVLTDSEPKPLPDIDNFDYLKFENWIAEGMAATQEWSVRETPRWGDKGADVVFVNKHKKDCGVIVQAKHVSLPDTSIGHEAVEQVLRSSGEYGLDTPSLVVITNAKKFTNKAVELARSKNVILVPRSHLSLWPEHVLA